MRSSIAFLRLRNSRRAYCRNQKFWRLWVDRRDSETVAACRQPSGGVDSAMATMQARSDILVRPLVESDLGEAARILCVAFGTFLGVADPERFLGDADMVRSRWKAEPSAVLAAEHNGKLIGSNFIAKWGSFGFFGPLTIEPEYWNRGVAQQLLVPTMEKFKRWGK